MIYGIGTDLVKIGRIDKVIQRWGDRFIARVFTPYETGICSERLSPPSAYALRFAAKEAFSKALGLGMRHGVKWRDIEVFNNSNGKPGLRLYGISSKIYHEKGLTSIHISLSDEGEYAMAMVVLEKA